MIRLLSFTFSNLSVLWYWISPWVSLIGLGSVTLPDLMLVLGLVAVRVQILSHAVPVLLCSIGTK